jgi:hypothetical protein
MVTTETQLLPYQLVIQMLMFKVFQLMIGQKDNSLNCNIPLQNLNMKIDKKKIDAWTQLDSLLSREEIKEKTLQQ